MTPTQARAHIADVRQRRRLGQTLAEQAEEYGQSLRKFVYAAWPFLGYPKPPETFHIDAICDHVQATYEREITRLLVTIQPGSFKSTIVSVLAPAWRWTTHPEERFVTASHGDDLATRDTTTSRTFMQSAWFQDRWGQVFEFTEAQNLKTRYANTRGGQRVRTHVGGGTGDRGSILQIDDPHNAKEARYADTQLAEAVQWWGDTAVSRLDDTVERPGSIIVIGQRIHPKDLIGYLLDSGGRRWTHLCLPTRYSEKHKYVYPRKVRLPSGRTLTGDIRRREGQLLMPKLQDEAKLADRVAEDGVTAHIFAGQYQQIPTEREGKILKRSGWRYYDRQLSFYRERGAFTAELVAELTAAGRMPVFSRIVHSWDTSVKDRAHSDFVSGQAWGCPRDRDADRWLLRLYHRRAALNETIDAMLMLNDWSLGIWPRVPHFVVIETAANGADAIAEIKGRVQGVIPWPAKGAAAAGSKVVRAEAASPALDGGNCYLPGYANETGDDYDPRTPLDVQAFIEELAEFDTGTHDDQVDGWSQMVNYTRRPHKRKGTLSVPRGRAPVPAGLPGMT